MASPLIRQSLVASARKAILKMLANRGISRLPSERKLCEELRISRPTLRQALRQLEKDGYVAPRQQHGWEILKHTHERSADKVMVVRLLQDDTANNFLNEHLQVLEFLATHLRSFQVEFHVETAHPCFSTNPMSALEDLVSRHPADLWILYLSTHAIQQWFQNRSIPCIALGSAYPDIDLISVDEDWEKASFHAAGMFLSKGHRHLAVLERENLRSGDQASIDGFTKGLKVSGHSDVRLQLVQHDETVPGIKRMIASLLTRDKKPTGWLVSNFYVYLTLCSYLASEGISVGHDISLICRRSDVHLDCLVPSVAHYRRNATRLHQRLLEVVNMMLQGATPTSRQWRILPEYCDGNSLQHAPRSKRQNASAACWFSSD